MDYLPTQYLAEYIKARGFEGIEYISTIHPDGFNLAIFNGEKLNCIKAELFEIIDLDYKYDPI